MQDNAVWSLWVDTGQSRDQMSMLNDEHLLSHLDEVLISCALAPETVSNSRSLGDAHENRLPRPLVLSRSSS